MNYWIPSARFVVLAVTLAAVGCGGGAKTARVSGKITYKSQPISYGQITFVGANGEQGVGPIEDGQYTILTAPTGAVKITVKAFPRSAQVVNPTETPQAKPAGPAAKGAPAVNVPAEYGDAATTKLTFTVTGDATHDIDLP